MSLNGPQPPHPVRFIEPVVVVDARMAHRTRVLLAVLARDLQEVGRPVPEGTWELVRAWEGRTPVSDGGNELPPADGQPAGELASSGRELIGTTEYARRAGVKPRTIRYRIEQGLLPAEPGPGGAWLIDPVHLGKKSA